MHNNSYVSRAMININDIKFVNQIPSELRDLDNNFDLTSNTHLEDLIINFDYDIQISTLKLASSPLNLITLNFAIELFILFKNFHNDFNNIK